jgi:Nif-specific regulatory protein
MPPTDEIVGTPRRAGRAASDANDPRGATKDIRRLSSLIEISQAMAATLNLSIALPQALDILERHHRVVRAHRAAGRGDRRALDRGIARPHARWPAGQCRLGEGRRPRWSSGKPIVVRKRAESPPLIRAAKRDRQEMTFICVPVVNKSRQRAGRGPGVPARRGATGR